MLDSVWDQAENPDRTRWFPQAPNEPSDLFRLSMANITEWDSNWCIRHLHTLCEPFSQN